jgi:hypothetical protein
VAIDDLLRLGRAFPELSDDSLLVVRWLVRVVYSQDSYSKRISVWQAKGSILVDMNHPGRMRVALRIAWVRHPAFREAENLARSGQRFLVRPAPFLQFPFCQEGC